MLSILIYHEIREAVAAFVVVALALMRFNMQRFTHLRDVGFQHKYVCEIENFQLWQY